MFTWNATLARSVKRALSVTLCLSYRKVSVIVFVEHFTEMQEFESGISHSRHDDVHFMFVKFSDFLCIFLINLSIIYEPSFISIYTNIPIKIADTYLACIFWYVKYYTSGFRQNNLTRKSDVPLHSAWTKCAAFEWD